MKKKLIRIIISFILLVIAFILKLDNTIINNFLFIISYLIVGYDIILKALRNITRGKVFDENFLMTIATIGAFFISEFPEAVAVMLFYQVGELFQSYAVDKSRKSVASLMDIRPDYANLYHDKKSERVDPNKVKFGDIILIKPGEKIPLDGIVVEGSSTLNTLALTGEAVPKSVSVNDEVLSGCINNEGILKVKVTKEFGESTVSKILDLVENASSRKSKSENFISKFAKYYTPIVVIIAILLALIPPLLTDTNFKTWLYRALSFLVVSCPCALVISIPLSFFAGIGASSRIGVLVKGSNYLEALANTEIVVCDKTGTLTEGIFEVQKVNSIGYSKEDLLRYTSYAESYSNHPIALSIKEAYGKDINEKLVTKTKELKGKGIIAKVESKEVLVGNEKLMIEYNIDYIKSNDIGTVIYIAIDKTFAGTIIISDKIKEDAYKAVKEFRENNVKKIVMLTGDREEISKNVSKELKLDKYYAELLPQDKVKKVESLMKEKSESGKLVFIGDGINDAPVLALSDIGVAMGGLGSDAAIEAADIVIMTDEPSKLANAIKISKKTMQIVKENIIFAITVKILVLLLSAVGIATMWAAVFADVGVSVIAIINALRILRVKKD
ncbi:MAG TPA: cadmium-translocating P-type ATPase [Candidatus Onthousia excrementipullorum]|uniref:Cd(2+)-exporting ATPase n=1 Tax=Candidatus Onthousia excrementipullorum TaxID=2840884 RepID=A0A9D1J3J6_9FIRM|nr:cadmium-translocating P-type ATPase [Candidatus Onthousia excrementipullorum]